MRMPRSRHRLRLRLEGGSAEGGELAFTVYTPVLFALLLVGVAFALIGFWRSGATMSAERGAAANGVAPGGSSAATAGAAQADAFETWAGASGGRTALEAGPGYRSDTLTFAAEAELRTGLLGAWTFALPGQGAARRERFYAGPPVCPPGEACHE